MNKKDRKTLIRMILLDHVINDHKLNALMKTELRDYQWMINKLSYHRDLTGIGLSNTAHNVTLWVRDPWGFDNYNLQWVYHYYDGFVHELVLSHDPSLNQSICKNYTRLDLFYIGLDHSICKFIVELFRIANS